MASKLTATFNDVDLSLYFTINSLDRGIGISKKMRTIERNNRTGVQFMGTSSFLYSFPMNITILNSLNIKRRELASILSVDEPKKLVFSDQPDIYYLAYPSIYTNIAEVLEIGKGTIIWEIPDGLAYSSRNYEFTNKDAGGVLQDVIYVNNPGTEPMELELEAAFSTDSGFLGLSTEDATVQCLFGDMEEIDGVVYEKSETLFNDHLFSDLEWSKNNGVVPPVTNSIIQQGTMGYKTESVGEGYAYPIDYGQNQEKWYGPSITKTIPMDKNGKYPTKFTVTYRADFNTDGAGADRPYQVGHQSLTLIDQNNQIICSVVLEDNHPTALKADNAVYVRNKRVYDDRQNNDYFRTARPGQNNHIRIEFIKDLIYVWVGGIRPFGQNTYLYAFPFTETGVELRKITFYTARFNAYPAIQNNLLRAINVVSHNVENWRDIPNKFKAGDVLTYGKRDRNFFCEVNGLNELRLRDVGSTSITVPPGLTAIYLAYSSFADTPEVALKGRARYTI